MKRALYYIFKVLSVFSRVLRSRVLYMRLLQKAHEFNGVVFIGLPRFIHPSAMLDGTAELRLGNNIVISTGVLCLTHDYSYTTGLIAIDKKPSTDHAVVKSVKIGDNCFLGANSTILPGTTIGDHVIIGAGSVVRGNIPAFSVVAGNPAVVIDDIRIWIRKRMDKTPESEIMIDIV